MPNAEQIPAAIRRRGFRKWYERELIRSHSHMLLLLFCSLAVIGALEALSDRGMTERLLLATSLLVAGGLGAWAMRRYLFFLGRAEQLAHQASCPKCHAYARWDIERELPGSESTDTVVVMQVRCRACGNGWSIGW